jgi:hypothetical protein
MKEREFPEFPEIPGVKFKLIPKRPGYAISSDGNVWIGHNGPWRKMEILKIHVCGPSVFLKMPEYTALGVISELMKEAFGENHGQES